MDPQQQRHSYNTSNAKYIYVYHAATELLAYIDQTAMIVSTLLLLTGVPATFAASGYIEAHIGTIEAPQFAKRQISGSSTDDITLNKNRTVSIM